MLEPESSVWRLTLKRARHLRWKNTNIFMSALLAGRPLISAIWGKYFTTRTPDMSRCNMTHNALGNRRAAFGASVLTDVLCGNGTEVGAGGTAKG